MGDYIHDDFLLDTPQARELYHEHAEKMPIIDYHCHLPPQEIAEDRRWHDVSQVWLGGDHYKWRQMRSNGVEERFITGEATGREKFQQYAQTLERLVGNPLLDWSQLELKRYFGIGERLTGASAERIWQACNARLAEPGFSARGLMLRSDVRVVCTTDDPVDSLAHHRAIAERPFATRILPAWRSDKAAKVENPVAWNAWVEALAAAAGQPIRTWEDFLAALAARHEFFARTGCVVSDYGLTEVCAEHYEEAQVARIFLKLRAGGEPTRDEARAFRSAWLYEGLKADARSNWTAQLHFGCLRDLNSTMFARLGPDTGFDAIGDWSQTEALARLFDRLERDDALPRTILYSLNPKDTEMLATLMGCFQKAPCPGRIQLGAAWWFLDQKDGMRRQLTALGALGCLGNFIGMLTDSRSFLSYTRHEYFRRLLCQKFGAEVARGELPDDLEWLGSLVEDIAFNNANRYFGFGA